MVIGDVLVGTAVDRPVLVLEVLLFELLRHRSVSSDDPSPLAVAAIGLLSPCSAGEVLGAHTERLDFIRFVVLTNAFAVGLD